MGETGRRLAEAALMERLKYSEHSLHVVDCGALGPVIVEREPEDSGWSFSWLSWTQTLTLNTPGLDLP